MRFTILIITFLFVFNFIVVKDIYSSDNSGKGFVGMNIYFFKAENRHIANGANEAIGEFYEATFQIYADYWVVDSINIFISFNFLKHITANAKGGIPNSPTESERVTYIGDLDIGFKYELYDFSLANTYVGLIFGIPTGNIEAGKGTSINANSYTIPTGNGDFNIIVFNQWNLDIDYFKLSFEVGYNFRSRNNSDEYYISLYPGVKLWYFTIEFGLRWQGSVKNRNRISNSLALTHASSSEFLVINPKISFAVSGFVIYTGIFIGLVAKNTPSTSVFHLGFGYQY